MIRFDQLPPEVTQAMCTPMHQILPPTPIASHPGYSTGALYLGSLAAVMDVDLLRQNHITHLVQVLDVPWMPLSEKEGFNCYRIDILDQSTVDISPHLEGACAHIDKTLKSGRSVLVHCQQVRIPCFHFLLSMVENRFYHFASRSSLTQCNPPGCVKKRLDCHCVPHPQSWYDIRRSSSSCQTQTCLHQAQLRLHQSSPGMGSILASSSNITSIHVLKDTKAPRNDVCEFSIAFKICRCYLVPVLFKICPFPVCSCMTSFSGTRHMMTYLTPFFFWTLINFFYIHSFFLVRRVFGPLFCFASFPTNTLLSPSIFQYFRCSLRDTRTL